MQVPPRTLKSFSSRYLMAISALAAVLGAFGRGDDREQRVGEHRDQGPAPPCEPAADLVLIEPGQALGGLKALDGPSASGDPDQFAEGPGRMQQCTRWLADIRRVTLLGSGALHNVRGPLPRLHLDDLAKVVDSALFLSLSVPDRVRSTRGAARLMNGNSDFRNPFERVRPAPPVPVLVLADVSGSMAHEGKIKVLNSSIAAMIRDFASEDSANGEIMVGVVTFGDDNAALHQPLIPVKNARWMDMSSGGNTPLGKAIDLVCRLVEDEEVMPERSSAPTIVLVSDGIPTDDWQTPLGRLLSSQRGAQTVRLAVAIGSEAGQSSYNVLQSFIANPAYPVLRADEVDRLSQFFQRLTRSITTHVRSGHAGGVPTFDPGELYDLAD